MLDDAAPSQDRPLAGIRVVDFTHVLAGPYCTQCLADAGATVIKVEPPGGEYGRLRGPHRRDGQGNAVSSFMLTANRGKRSITLDLKDPSALSIARRLIKSADIVVENFAPGKLARLGLDLEALQVEQPSLITVSISLFGGGRSAGVFAGRAGLAVVAEGESSITRMTTDAEGVPVPLGFPLGDMAAAVVAYGAIVTALIGRGATGEGRHIDISMVKSLWGFNSGTVVADQIDSTGQGVLAPAGYGIFRATDGYVTIGVNSDTLFARLMEAMDMPSVAEDPRYAQAHDRDAARDDVNAIITGWTSQHCIDDIVNALSGAGVPCGRVSTVADVLADRRLDPLGLVEESDDSLGGVILTPANPMGLKRDRELSAVPGVGEHSREILAEIGVDDREFETLRSSGAFGPTVVTA